ncbi:MAG: hypothetical protein JXM68_09460, partial [Sedimentisphaerales bacterium]|nr:hypothetical protein [Sedimentisphaerales bacterium]
DIADITNGTITMSARFNPDASMAVGGPYIVIEAGGTSNGTGLYLADGDLILMAKANSARYAVPVSLNDRDFSDGVLAVNFGPVNFGAENIVYASLNVNTGVLYGSVNGVLTTYGLSGCSGAENVDGNRSVSFLGSGAIADFGFMGGLLEAGQEQYPLLFWTSAVNMVQTSGYANQRGQVFALAVNGPAIPYNITAVESSGVTRVAEGGYTDQVEISVSDNPGAYPVTVSIIDTLDPEQVLCSPAQIVFNSSNWQAAQTITLTAIDDADMERAEHDTILELNVSVAQQSPYYGKTLTDIFVYIVENDCGAYGFNPGDFNLDCQVDLNDFVIFVDSWLACSNVDPDCQVFVY